MFRSRLLYTTFVLVLLFAPAIIPDPHAAPLLITARAQEPETNGCGADWFPVPDGPLLSQLLTWWNADVFLDACNAHDICYATAGKSQTDCDNAFWADLLASCNTWPGIIDPTCPTFAHLYFAAVTSFGGIAFEDAQGPPKGQILSTMAEVIDGDELVVVVAVANTGGYGEFGVELRAANGELVDEEPDGYWQDILAGGTALFTLTTNWDPFWNIFDVGTIAYVVLVEEESGDHDSEELADLPMPGADINQVTTYKIDDWWGDDEFEACVTFTNTGRAQGEFDVKLFGEDGTFIDEEPDGYWLDVDAGTQVEICVGTNYIWESWSDLGDSFTVVVNEEHLGEMGRYAGNLNSASAAQSPHGGAVAYFVPDGPIKTGWEVLETRMIDPAPPDGQGLLTVKSSGSYGVFAAGSDSSVWSWTGDWTIQLPPGTYTIRDNLTNLIGEAMVQGAMETVLAVDMGTLVVMDPGQAGYALFPAGSDTEVSSWRGDWTFGLKSGDYEIRDPAGAVIARATVGRGATTTADLPTGSLVVSDPGAAGFEVYPVGSDTRLWEWRGNWTLGLYAGEYEIRGPGGQVVWRGRVERGATTTADLPTGSLVVSDPGAAGFEVYPAGSDTRLWEWRGDWTLGLYAGEYEIRRGETMLGHVTIRRGETTTFSVGN